MIISDMENDVNTEIKLYAIVKNIHFRVLQDTTATFTRRKMILSLRNYVFLNT